MNGRLRLVDAEPIYAITRDGAPQGGHLKRADFHMRTTADEDKEKPSAFREHFWSDTQHEARG